MNNQNDFVSLVHQVKGPQASGRIGGRAQSPAGHGRDPEADGQAKAFYASELRCWMHVPRSGLGRSKRLPDSPAHHVVESVASLLEEKEALLADTTRHADLGTAIAAEMITD